MDDDPPAVVVELVPVVPDGKDVTDVPEVALPVPVVVDDDEVDDRGQAAWHKAWVVYGPYPPPLELAVHWSFGPQYHPDKQPYPSHMSRNG